MTEEEKKEPADDMIKKAEAAAARLEAANKKAEELAERQEANAAREVLSGKADAGQQPPPEQPETNQEYVDRLMRDGKDTKAKRA